MRSSDASCRTCYLRGSTQSAPRGCGARPSPPPAPTPALAGGTCPRPTSNRAQPGGPSERRLVFTPASGATLSILRSRPAGPDRPAPPSPEGAAMNDRVAVLLPLSGLHVAMAPPTRGSLPPVCLPLGNPLRNSASAPCFSPWDRPLHQASMPSHPLNARALSSQPLANLLVKRPRLD